MRHGAMGHDECGGRRRWTRVRAWFGRLGRRWRQNTALTRRIRTIENVHECTLRLARVRIVGDVDGLLTRGG